MMRPVILLGFLLFAAVSGSAQTPTVTWGRLLGSYNGDYGQTVRTTRDGGYIVAGYTESGGGDVVGYHGNKYVDDIWVVKVSAAGMIQWQKCLGGKSVETGADIRETADGGYIVAGSTASRDCDITGHRGLDYWLLKLSATGDIQWQHTYGGDGNDYATSVDITPDGGYILGGYSNSFNADLTTNMGVFDFLIIRVDASGNQLWLKNLGSSGSDECFGIRATPDGGCVAVGVVRGGDGDVTGYHGSEDAWVIRLDNTGALQWQRCLGGSSLDNAWSVQLTQDGGYILAGGTASTDGDASGLHGGLDAWVVKLAPGGNLQWQHCYGGSKSEQGFYIQLAPDGGYFVACSAQSADGDLTCNNGYDDMWVFKTSGDGTLQWQQDVGGNNYDMAYGVEPLNDGGCILTGYSMSRDIPGWHTHTTSDGTAPDVALVRIAPPAAVSATPAVGIQATTVLCSGNPSTLTALATNFGLNVTYAWTRNGQPVGTNSPTYTAADFADGDLVTCQVTGTGRCTGSSPQASAQYTVRLNPRILTPHITITADQTVVCPCMKINFTSAVTQGGTQPAYQWYVNGLPTGEVNPFFSSTNLAPLDIVTCQYADSSGCIAGGWVYSNNIQLGVAGTTPPSVSLSASTDTICAGMPVTFRATAKNAGSKPGFQWKLNNQPVAGTADTLTLSGLANGDQITCTVQVDPNYGCASAASATSAPVRIFVETAGAPAVSIQTPSTTVCSGVPVTFTATTTHVGINPVYHWFINGVDQGAGGPTLTRSNLASGDRVSCTVTVDPLYACATAPSAVSDTLVMAVTTPLQPAVTVSVTGNGACQGSTVRFAAQVTQAGASPTYAWLVNNQPVGAGTAQFSSTSLGNGDVVTCQVTPGQETCVTSPVSSAAITVLMYPVPSVEVSPADTVVAVGSQVRLRGQVTANTASFQWDPASQLVDPQDLDPLTQPLFQDLTCLLHVTSDHGCQASGMAVIRLNRELYLPSAFTPNGDGKNDLFRIPAGTTLELREFSVYDRWGNKVFTTQDITRGWDGTWQGRQLPAGVYVYIVRGVTVKGPILHRGTVALVR
ncbi:MAG TPA: gliding motility-associated C-terminal domain-containing protein [Chitinophagaceae bacterium]|nr:gliding motility-associated C-terminal domain-containing protein [Chitinophagaceae bacterium]